MGQNAVKPKTNLYLFMVLHVLFAAGTFIFSKAAAVSFANPMVLTVSRDLGPLFLLGMVLSLSGVIMIQKARE